MYPVNTQHPVFDLGSMFVGVQLFFVGCGAGLGCSGSGVFFIGFMML